MPSPNKLSHKSWHSHKWNVITIKVGIVPSFPIPVPPPHLVVQVTAKVPALRDEVPSAIHSQSNCPSGLLWCSMIIWLFDLSLLLILNEWKWSISFLLLNRLVNEQMNIQQNIYMKKNNILVIEKIRLHNINSMFSIILSCGGKMLCPPVNTHTHTPGWYYTKYQQCIFLAQVKSIYMGGNYDPTQKISGSSFPLVQSRAVPH